MFTVQNAVLVALFQVGVIVAGVLAAGLNLKFWNESLPGNRIPFLTGFLTSYGFLVLLIPLFWIGVAMRIRRGTNISDDVKSLVFFSGIVLLIGLVMFMGYSVISPWLNIGWGTAPSEE